MEKNRDGFTLIELLVVIAIIAILMLLVVPRFIGFQKIAAEQTFMANHRVAISAVDAYMAFNQKEPTSIDDLQDLLRNFQDDNPRGSTYKIKNDTLVSVLDGQYTKDGATIIMTYDMASGRNTTSYGNAISD